MPEAMETMDDKSHMYYKASGKLTGLGVVLMFVGGVTAGFILGPVYAALTHFIPLVGIVNVIFIAGVGYGVGLAIVAGGRIGKVRNTLVAAAVGAVGGVFALYMAWGFYACILYEVWLSDLSLFSPEKLWSIILEINEKGAWSFKDSTPTGIILWIFWVLEAGSFIVVTALIAAGITDTPFCEDCECWTEETSDAAKLELVDNPHMLTKALEAGHYEIFDMMQPVEKATLVKYSAADRKAMKKKIKAAARKAEKTGDEEQLNRVKEDNRMPEIRQYLSLNTHQCPNCRENCYLTINCVTIAPNDKNEDEEKSEALVEQIRVPKEVVANVLEISCREPIEKEGLLEAAEDTQA